MKTTLFPRVALVVALLIGVVGRAQPASTGVIEGRVFNTVSGQNLETARVTIEGTGLETFTDNAGGYRFDSVPAGTVKVRAFFTGLAPLTQEVAVIAGRSAPNDFALAAVAAPPRAGTTDSTGPIKLSEFSVRAAREMTGAAIAINEQRFAPNITNVVSAEEFGTIAEGNVAEFMKFLPGVTVGYADGDAREISINGVPSNNVPVTYGGFSLASGTPSTSRAIQLDQVSINNASRIEVSHSPTPESQGAALAGSVNVVPRSAFERSKPLFTANAYVMLRDREFTLNKTPGPGREPTRKVYPGFDFSYVAPVNKRFGFTLSGNTSNQYSAIDVAAPMWSGVALATNGVAFPDPVVGQPYLADYLLQASTKFTTRSSLGATLDWKIGAHDQVSLSFMTSYYLQELSFRMLRIQLNRVAPGDYTATSTRGAVGQGGLTLTNSMRDRSGTTYMPTLTWRHNGPIWKADAGAAFSNANIHYRDIDRGHFAGTTARRTGVTINFDEIGFLRPGRIAVTEGATGVPVDYANINSYVLTGANGNPTDTADIQRTAYANLRRDLVVRGTPLSLKAGLDVRNQMRDRRNLTWSAAPFVGEDRRATTTPRDPAGSDDGAAAVLDESYAQAPFRFGRVQWVSNYKAWELYNAHPEYFTFDQNLLYTSDVNNSKRAAEIISAAYLRGDVALLGNRLKLVGGLRAEQTDIKAEGPLTDATRNFQRDSAGHVILGANGRPLPIATDPLAISRLTLLRRAFHADKEYLRLFPSLNASFNVRDNLVARAAYYESVGRPDFNQYAGGVTLPDVDAAASPANRIALSNVAIKAWSARTVKVRLEHYFEGVGQVSVGAFRRDFENFFTNATFRPTPEFLELYGLDPATYGRFEVATQSNAADTVRMTGLEFDYKQALTFLPLWARGVQVFANASALRATGEATENFSGYAPRSANWGVSLSREKFTVRLNWNLVSRRRGAAVTGRGIEPGTYNWQAERLYLDASAEYFLSRRLALFVNGRNIHDEPADLEIAGPSTPGHAQLRSRNQNGALWTFGVKGTF